jgi:hypothetical protein
MKKLTLIVLAAGAAAAAAGCSTSQRFGAPQSVSGKALPLEQALTPANVGKTIAIRGQVTEVCQMKGCWMVLTDGKLSVRTTFKDYGFFVPKDLAGARVVAEGTLKRETVPEEMRRHFAEDAGQSPSEIASIHGSSEEYAFVADSVTVRR